MFYYNSKYHMFTLTNYCYEFRYTVCFPRIMFFIYIENCLNNDVRFYNLMVNDNWVCHTSKVHMLILVLLKG